MEKSAFEIVGNVTWAQIVRNRRCDRIFLFGHRLQDFADRDIRLRNLWQIATLRALAPPFGLVVS
jgi:hypothetical protein